MTSPPPPPPAIPTPKLPLSRPLVLVGMMGAGKSSAARRLAERLGCPCLDSDWEIEQRTGLTIRHFFASEGEAAFRAMEHKVISELLARRPCAVIASGGGSFIQDPLRQLIRQQGVAIWLRASLETLAARVLGPQLAKRPLLAGTDDPRTILAGLLEARAPLYGQAHLTLEVDGLKPDAVADQILAALPAVLEKLS